MREEVRRGALAWSAGFALAVWAGLRLGGVFTQVDSSSYLDLAAGRQAMLPFAWRQLGPLIVRAIAAGFQTNIERGFLAEGIVALAVFLALAITLLIRSRAPRWMIPAIVGMFFWAAELNRLVLPDLTYAALLAVFLWLLSSNRVLLAGLMLFPLSLARESTLLVLVCLLIAGYRRLRAREWIVAVAATAAGVLTVWALTRHALPNSEHLPGALYLAAKVPGNLSRNVFGIEPWANIYPGCAVPVWQMHVHLGPLQAIGVCRFGPEYPLQMLGLALASFGLLPLLLLRLRGRVGLHERGLLLRFCVIYGAVSFLAAPLEGFLVSRLFDYGWPLFLVALPLLLRASGAKFSSTRAALAFVGLHLLVSWSVWWIFFVAPTPLLAVEATLYFAGWWVVRKHLVFDGLPSHFRTGLEPRF